MVRSIPFNHSFPCMLYLVVLRLDDLSLNAFRICSMVICLQHLWVESDGQQSKWSCGQCAETFTLVFLKRYDLLRWQSWAHTNGVVRKGCEPKGQNIFLNNFRINLTAELGLGGQPSRFSSSIPSRQEARNLNYPLTKIERTLKNETLCIIFSDTSDRPSNDPKDHKSPSSVQVRQEYLESAHRKLPV